MNVHDSERLSGSLEAWATSRRRRRARHRRDQHVRGPRERRQQALRQPRPPRRRQAPPRGMQIAVGGCLAQKDKNVILEKAPWVDVVFGTHNMGSLPSLLERARTTTRRSSRSSTRSRSSRRRCRPSATRSYSGWVSISVGCNNTCTFCIVPALRGKRRPPRRDPRRDPGCSSTTAPSRSRCSART